MSRPNQSVLDRAIHFAKSGDDASLGGISSYEWQDHLMAYAESNRRAGEALGKALVRLSKRDGIAGALAGAANAAAEREASMTLAEKSELLKRSLLPTDRESAEYVEGILDRLAKALQRPEESFAQSYSRLLKEDSAFLGAYCVFLERKQI